MAPHEVGQAIEARLNLLESRRVVLDAIGVGVQRARRLLKANHGLAQLVGDGCQLGIAVGGGAHRALGLARHAEGASTIIGRKQCRGARRPLSEHVGITQALTLDLEFVELARARLNLRDALGNALQLRDAPGEPRGLRFGLLARAACCHECAPCGAHRHDLGGLLVTTEGIEDRALRSRLGQAARLVLRNDAHQSAARIFESTTCGAAALYQRASAPIGTESTRYE